MARPAQRGFTKEAAYMGADFDLSSQGKEAISDALRADYAGTKGARLRHIDSINGEKAAGSTWHEMKVGEERVLKHKKGALIRIKRVK